MKKVVLFMSFVLSWLLANAAFVENMKVARIQPSGDTLHCYVSGDEFFHRLHDENGYTIIQDPRTGYYVYADFSDGKLVATNYIVGTVNPSNVGLKPNLIPSSEELLEMREMWKVPSSASAPGPEALGASFPELNNIVIYIRFSDEDEISTSQTSIDNSFNASGSTDISMYNYFKKVSYNQCNITTTFYPAPTGSQVHSYQDSHPRAYYEPYNAVTNLIGYSNDSERANREFTLLQNAVDYVNTNSPVPSTLNLDINNDGLVDNVCFIVKGTYTGWNDLLWPHKWSLHDRVVTINGKRVYTFNLQLEGSGDTYFGTSTFCHEMFHTLGAPDLYHYNSYTGVQPAGYWDLMGLNTNPPQHTNAFMKYKYGGWISSIPEITVSGTYTLNSVSSSTNNCYKIQSSDPNQYYVLEYRNKNDLFESGLSGSGLLIWRVDKRFSGCANSDMVTYFDEVYVYRPGASQNTLNGSSSLAFFSGESGRTDFSAYSNPPAFLNGGEIDHNIVISNISTTGNTITFTYTRVNACWEPENRMVTNVTNNSADFSWNGPAEHYNLKVKNLATNEEHVYYVTGDSYHLSGLSGLTQYSWSVQSLCSESLIGDYSEEDVFQTDICSNPMIDSLYTTSTVNKYQYPINNYYKYSYSQQIYRASDMGGAKEITKLGFYYNYSNPITCKTNCTIYLAHTSLDIFTNTSLIPASSLTKVYEGPLNFSKGWNDIILTSPFSYDGENNLLLVVADNSGAYYTSSATLKHKEQPDCRMLAFWSDSYGIDPGNLSAVPSSATIRKVNFNTTIRINYCEVAVEPTTYTISATANPVEGGTVSGAGSYGMGDTITLTAVPGTGYEFSSWNNGETSSTMTVVVNGDANYVANFTPFSYDISASVYPENGGTVSGQGSYDYGTVATLTAHPHSGYAFGGWLDGSMENPRVVSVTNDAQYLAIFEHKADTVFVLQVDTVMVDRFIHDTTIVDNYIEVPVHDTTIVDNYIEVPVEVIVRDTTYLTEYVEVPVHDTTIVDNYIEVPVEVIVRDTTYLTEYVEVPVHDTTIVDNYIEVPVEVILRDTTYLTEYVEVPVHDTTIVDNYIEVPVEVIVRDTTYLTEYVEVPVHDTTIVDNYIEVPVEVIVRDTTYLTEYVEVPVHDTTIVDNYIEVPVEVIVRDTTYLTEYVEVPVHDTIIVDNYIEVPVEVIVRDTTYLTEYVEVPVHDTTIVDNYIEVPVEVIVRDTTYLTEYVEVPVHDTTIVDNYIEVHDTLYSTVTEYVEIYDTVIQSLTAYQLKVRPNNTAYGYTYGNAVVLEGSSVQIVAVPEKNYQFISWSDGNTNATRYVTVNSNMSITANFRKKNFFFFTPESDDAAITDELVSESDEDIEKKIQTAEQPIPDVKVYPNPTTALVNISRSAEKIEIWDASGRRIVVKENTNQIDFTSLATGTYVLRIYLPEGVQTKRVVKK